MTTVLSIGALWGICEATLGYALHLLPWKIGAYVWFPAAYFFMDRAYRIVGKRWAVLAVAVTASAIKLLNLFSPVRLDYVVNPAVSIILESLAMAGVLSVAARSDKRTIGASMATVLATNSLWRLMYGLYLALLAPVWMREGSAIRSMEAYLSFIFRENMVSSLVCAVLLAVYDRTDRDAPHVRIIIMNKRARCVLAGGVLCFSALVQFVL